MTRIALQLLEQRLESAYRTDPVHAVLQNLKSVRPEEWAVRPLNPSVGEDSEFGRNPVLSIADLVEHIGSAKRRFGALAFGAEMPQDGPPSRDMEAMLAWLEEGHAAFVAAVAALEDDSALEAERETRGGRTMRVDQIIGLVTNHDLYHAGEINRQRGLIRGSEGWDRSAGG